MFCIKKWGLRHCNYFSAIRVFLSLLVLLPVFDIILVASYPCCWCVAVIVILVAGFRAIAVATVGRCEFCHSFRSPPSMLTVTMQP